MSKKNTITYSHRKGKGGSVSAETADREKIAAAPTKGKKAPQPAVDQQKEG